MRNSNPIYWFNVTLHYSTKIQKMLQILIISIFVCKNIKLVKTNTNISYFCVYKVQMLVFYLLGLPSSVQNSVNFPFEITSALPLWTIVSPPKCLATSLTMTGSGWTVGPTSAHLNTVWTSLENSIAFGVRTARL